MNVSSLSVSPFFVLSDVPSSAIQKLNSFLSMEDGWYFGMGVAPSKREIRRAMLVANLMEWRGFDVEAFPGESGEVLVSGRIGDLLLEVTLEGPGAFTIETRRRGEQSEPEAIPSFNELIKRIWSTAPACNIYDSLIRGGGASVTAASMIWPSSRPALPAAGASLLSKHIVHAERPERRALTWKNSTARNSPRRSLFGNSTATYFQVTK